MPQLLVIPTTTDKQSCFRCSAVTADKIVLKLHLGQLPAASTTSATSWTQGVLRRFLVFHLLWCLPVSQRLISQLYSIDKPIHYTTCSMVFRAFTLAAHNMLSTISKTRHSPPSHYTGCRIPRSYGKFQRRVLSMAKSNLWYRSLIATSTSTKGDIGCYRFRCYGSLISKEEVNYRTKIIEQIRSRL